jgi:Bacterial RNA polymerase, alpha chain C terminal domain
MSRGPRWSDEEVALLRADYAAFVPVHEIAAKLGRGVAATGLRVHLYGLRRTRGVAQALKWVPEHLKVQVGHVPDDQWLRMCHEWRKTLPQVARDERQAAWDERQARLAASCQEIDGSDVSRNEKVVAKRALGMTLKAIALQHGITTERVRQICNPPPKSDLRERQRLDWLARDEAAQSTTSTSLAMPPTVRETPQPKPVPSRRGTLRDGQRLDRLVEIWSLCPPRVRARFLMAIAGEGEPSLAPVPEVGDQGLGVQPKVSYAERNQRIVEAYDKAGSYTEVGRQFRLSSEAVKGIVLRMKVEAIRRAERELPDMLDNRPVEALGLSLRARNVLARLGVYTVEQAAKVTTQELKSLPGCGNQTIVEIAAALRKALESSPLLPADT